MYEVEDILIRSRFFKEGGHGLAVHAFSWRFRRFGSQGLDWIGRIGFGIEIPSAPMHVIVLIRGGLNTGGILSSFVFSGICIRDRSS